MQVFKQVLLLSLAVTHIEGIACILLMVKDVHLRSRQLVIIRALIVNIWITTSTCIVEAVLMGDMGIIGTSYSISVCLHNFLAWPWLPRCCWSDATILRKLAMTELLIVSWSHPVVLTAVKLTVRIFTVIKVVSCKGKSCYIIFVWNNSSCMGRITGIGLLWLLLVFQIALNERSDGCLIVRRSRIRSSLMILIVNARMAYASSCRRLWLWLAVSASLTVLMTCTLATRNLVKIQIMTALTSWALRKLASILCEVRSSWCIVGCIHNGCASLRTELSLFLIGWML